MRAGTLGLAFCAACLQSHLLEAEETEPLFQAGDPIVDLDPLVIIGTEDELDPGRLPLSSVAATVTSHLGSAQRLAELPGVSLASRGAFAKEPVIRGLGFDRVATSLNGLRLPNASPTRTQAPLGQISIQPFQSVTVSRFLSSLADGPPVSGGRISLQSNPDLGVRAEPDNRPDARFGFAWHPDRDGHAWQAGLDVKLDSFAIRASLDKSRFGNYKSGNGLEVPSRHETAGGAISVIHNPAGNGWSHSLDGIYRRQRFTENASLPLDTDNGEFWALTSVHTIRPGVSDGRLRLRLGLTEAEATLSNRNRPLAPIQVVTDTAARAAHIDLEWAVSMDDDSGLVIGIDGNQERRNAIRRRGSVGVDAIWPDIRYRQAGLYLQGRSQPASRLSLRTEARFDYAQSRAGLGNRIAFGKPLVSLFSRYNNSGSEQARQIERVLSANLLLSFKVSPDLHLYAGTGSSAQIPPPTERYRAFLNALGGGFELGNPDLDPERKQELVFGAILRTDRLNLQADFTLFRIDDFIWRQRIGNTAGTLPLSPPVPVFGYRNVAAAFHGFDLHGAWQINDQLQIPFAISWIRAELRESGPNYRKGDRLPEIPPPDLKIGAAYRFVFKATEGSVQWMIRHTAKGRNELSALNPLYADTSAHTQQDVTLSLSRGESLSLQISLLNIFDETVYPYLSPPVSSIRPASGELAPGERVPGPGRELVISLRMSF